MLLREAMAFVKATTRKGWEKLPNGRKNKPEYAERAVLEAMVNHDKEYHEDCGTGKGYWVITYSDGSTSVE